MARIASQERCKVPRFNSMILEGIACAPAEVQADLRGHLASCSVCRRELELLRRMQSSWDKRELSPQQISYLRRRIAARSNDHGARSRYRTPVRVGLAMLLVGTAATAAAGTFIWSGFGARTESAGSIPTASTAIIAPAPAPSVGASVPVEAGASTAAKAPEVKGVVRANRSIPRSAVVALPGEQRDTKSAATPNDARWGKVAEAMKQGDEAKAEVMLNGIVRSADSESKDAARLALAEMWISSQRREESRPVLAELSRTGSTPLIRKRATELLRTLK
ncbi:MAG: hypothetical protein SFV15_25445 [Polyangiaceae bacterium]|nr:hypothetical protein [Polyangiaceae bacterium]